MTNAATEANYAADVRRAYAAAKEWVLAHEGLALTFLDWGAGGLLCSLSEIADEWCAGDKDSRALLQVMIDATEDRCTYMQAKFVLNHVLLELGAPGGDT